jgi:hypothetical protein
VGDPERVAAPQDATHLSGLLLLFIQPGQGRFHHPGLPEPQESVQRERPGPPCQRVRRDEQPGQPFGSPESGQRLVLTAARKLDCSASVVCRYPLGRLHLRPNGTLSAVQPRLCLLQPALAERWDAEHHIGGRGVTGSSAQPCRRASSIACILSSTACRVDRSQATNAQFASPSTSR